VKCIDSAESFDHKANGVAFQLIYAETSPLDVRESV
jgi:hypothetical protein